MTDGKKYLNFLGWFGGIVCLSSYTLITQQILSSNSFVFLLMNVIGCVCLIYYTFCKGAFANAALNSVHLLITLAAITTKILTR